VTKLDEVICSAIIAIAILLKRRNQNAEQKNREWSVQQLATKTACCLTFICNKNLNFIRNIAIISSV
jgi:hypothetical protein